jgi:hypothetical protein
MFYGTEIVVALLENLEGTPASFVLYLLLDTTIIFTTLSIFKYKMFWLCEVHVFSVEILGPILMAYNRF